MVNPEHETIPYYEVSCTKDEAVAMLLGWMQGRERSKYIRMTEDGIPEDQLLSLYTLDAPIQEYLEALRASAYEKFLTARDSDAPSDDLLEEKANIAAKYDELANRAWNYLLDIADEIANGDIAKGGSSALRIDHEKTAKTGVQHYTLKSVAVWAKNKYELTINDALDISPGRTIEPQASPLAKIEGSKPEKKKFRQQEELIMSEIMRLGYDCKKLPKNSSGKAGVKAEIRACLLEHPLFPGTKIFDNAWERLTKDQDIVILKPVSSP